MVSGSRLKAGQMAQKYVKEQGGINEAQVIGSAIKTTAINAAFANGIMGMLMKLMIPSMASFTHPGCGIVPAALAMAEREATDGLSFLKGVVVGYDIGCRITKALGITHRENAHSSHSIGNNFGAAAAAASIARLNSDRSSMSYLMLRNKLQVYITCIVTRNTLRKLLSLAVMRHGMA